MVIFFISFFLFFVDARFVDEHALHIHHRIDWSGNVFIAERRHIGFTKFVGAGDSSATPLKPTQPAKTLREILTKMTKWSTKKGKLFRKWQVLFDDVEKQLVNTASDEWPLDPTSGSTRGWYYGSPNY